MNTLIYSQNKHLKLETFGTAVTLSPRSDWFLKDQFVLLLWTIPDTAGLSQPFQSTVPSTSTFISPSLSGKTDGSSGKTIVPLIFKTKVK